LIAYSKNAPVLHSLGGVRVVRLSQTLALKCGTGVLPSEGETMKYVAANFPEVRLPKVYRVFHVTYDLSIFGMRGYIVMDYVNGRSLDSCWDQLEAKVQIDIVNQVAYMVNRLQAKHFTSPSVIGGGVSRGYYFSDFGAGPFTTKKDFEKWFNWKLALSKQFQRAAADVPPIQYSRFVITHCDITPRNLILDAQGQAWLIDWGCAGIYPPIFEATTLKHQAQFPTFTSLLQPLIYHDEKEMKQLESCTYGIRILILSHSP